MQFAVATGLIGSDPTTAFEPAKAKAGRIHTWTETEIEQYEARHPIGSRARLVMALLLYTGQRRGDVVRMGPPIRRGVLSVTQQKPAPSWRSQLILASPRSSPRRNADTWPFW